MLRVSYVGFPANQGGVETIKPLTIVMKDGGVNLDEVVVTALGITREQKSLGYAVSKVSSEELNNTVAGNWLNSMNGKVAGSVDDQRRLGPARFDARGASR